MHFAFICKDKADGQALRAANRQAHLDYLRSFYGRIVAAGPLQSDDGQRMTGSLLILDLADRAEAEAFAAGDPYAQAGLFANVEIHRWKQVLPVAG
jgi:hypothetical protein